jgi:hypothetical protein
MTSRQSIFDYVDSAYTAGVDDRIDPDYAPKEIIYPKDKPAVKDKVVQKLIPDKISECALGVGTDGICIGKEILEYVAEAVGVPSTTSPAEIVSQAKKVTGCKTEKCAITKLRTKIGPMANKALGTLYKIDGPTDNSLLNNVHIDAIMQQWASQHKWFYAYNFNMLNYAQYSFRSGQILAEPDTLATVDITQLRARGYTCAGCVVNSDKYQGPGKHWMALFVDMRKGTGSIEFFNSSGNSPAPEWVNWMVKTANALTSAGVESTTLKVTSIKHQQSRSECGLYSLFYIYARINDIPAKYFMNSHIADQLMFEFRQHLFESGKSNVTFDWDKYRAAVHIEWEDKQ